MRIASVGRAAAAYGLSFVLLLPLAGCAGGASAKTAADAEYPATAGYPQPAPNGGPVEASRHVSGAQAVREEISTRDRDTVAFEDVNVSGSMAQPDGARAAPPAPAPAPAPPSPPPQPSAPTAGAPGAARSEKKAEPTAQPAPSRDLVIYTARFTMAVYLVDQGLAAVEKIAHDNGGYLGQKSDREITVRIPRGRFDPTLAAIDRIGDVIHRDIQAQDVTDEHVDLEIRIKNARAMQKRLSDLLTHASVKDALEIEKELHRVTEELERLEGKMKVLKDKIAFSTVTVTFTPRGSTIQTARVRLPFPWLGGLNLPSLLSLHEEK
jgi:hypothetical protein